MSRNRHGKRSEENANAKAIEDAFKMGAPDHRPAGHVYKGQEEYAEDKPLIIRPLPICWGIPMDETMYSKFFTMFFRHGHIMPWDGIATTESTYLPSARNDIHNRFLKSGYPYLMMLDSDVLIAENMVERLLGHNKPIVGGWYASKNRPGSYTPHPIVYDYIKTTDEGEIHWLHKEKPGVGLEQVDGMGAGCWLMKREVAEALGETPYDMGGATEDLKISKKLLDLGIPMFVDWDIHCPHLGVSWT
jgi:hypothetical protein